MFGDDDRENRESGDDVDDSDLLTSKLFFSVAHTVCNRCVYACHTMLPFQNETRKFLNGCLVNLEKKERELVTGNLETSLV